MESGKLPSERLTRQGIRCGTLLAVLLAFTPQSSANDYAEQRAAAVKNCRAIDPKEHHTGLIMNPEGYRSYYVRSACIQRTAVKFRDPELCEEVRRRRALFSSSWGYSEKNCRELVQAGIRKDGETLDAMKREYDRGHVRITDFTVERNGNGRDYDIIPRFAGEGAHGYRLQFAILPDEPGAAPVPVHASGFYLRGSENNIRIFITQAELRERFPAFRPENRYTVRATLTLSTGHGSQAGRWSDAFIESHFPIASRSRHLEKDIDFDMEWVPMKYP